MKPVFRHAALAFALLPVYGIANAAEPGSAGSMLQVLPGLGVVLGLIAVCAWVAKRIGPGRIAGGQAIKFVASQSVGSRERVVIVEVNQQWLVLGVAPGRVSTLSQMDKPEAPAETNAGTPNQFAKPPFAAWLEKALSKK
jgi:flagellar protein FliO/FliZ